MKKSQLLSCGLVVASVLGSTLLASSVANAAPVPSSGASPAALSRSSSATALAPITVTSPYTGGFSTTVSGTASPNALIRLVVGGFEGGARADASGLWSVANVPSGDATLQGTVSQIVGGETSALPFTLYRDGQVPTPAAPLTVSTTTFVRGAQSTVITGTGQPDTLLQLVVGGREYAGKTDATGAWSITVTGLSAVTYTGTVKQIAASGTASTDFVLTAEGETPGAPAPVTIATRDYDENALFVTVSGTAEPNALVQVLVNSREYATKAAADGTWSVDNVFSFYGPKTTVKATQFTDAGSSSVTSVLTARTTPTPPPAGVAPISVAAPLDPALGYMPNTAFTFSGTADKGASNVTIRNFSGTTIGTAPVDAKTGAWSWTRANMGTSTWKLKFTAADGTAKATTTTLDAFAPATPAAAVKPLAFTNPQNPAAGFAAGTAFTFRGTGRAGAVISLQNDKGTVFASGIRVAADGTWSWTRANMGTSTWKITAVTDKGSATEAQVMLAPFAPAK